MSWVEKIDPGVARLALDAAEALARAAWNAIRGEPTQHDEAAIKAVARSALLAQLGATEREAQALRDGVELGMALQLLATNASAAVAAIERAAHPGSVPVITGPFDFSETEPSGGEG